MTYSRGNADVPLHCSVHQEQAHALTKWPTLVLQQHVTLRGPTTLTYIVKNTSENQWIHFLSVMTTMK